MAADIQALGRPVFLGQLYNSHTSSLLNDSLFPTAIATQFTATEPASLTDIQYEEVRTAKERAAKLDVSASLSCSILGGSIDLSGAGSYLDRSESTQESASITAYVKTKTKRDYLRVEEGNLQNAVQISPENLRKTGATHVVTVITYGANLWSSLTEANSTSNKETDTKGSFSIKVFQDMGGFAGAEGQAKLEANHKEKLANYSLELRMNGDFLDSASNVKFPVTPVALSAKLLNATGLLNVPVPITFELIPLNFFDKVSTVLLFRELEDDGLDKMIELYDRIVTLDQDRKKLLARVETKEGEFFPTFRNRCEAREREVELLVSRYRARLGTFLREMRGNVDKDSVQATKEFMLDGNQSYNQAKSSFDEDFAFWDTSIKQMESATKSKIPFVSVADLSAIMNLPAQNPVAVVIVPPDVLKNALINTYDGLVETINIWHKTQQAERGAQEGVALPDISFCSVYADTDEELNKQLLLLDGESKAIETAVLKARETHRPALLSYGVSKRDHLGLVDWSYSGLQGQDGWGIVVDEAAGTKYTGDLRNSVPHGSGTMRYSNGSSYTGSWFHGARDGVGMVWWSKEAAENEGLLDVLVEKDGIFVEKEGIFVDDDLPPHSRVITIIVYKNHVPINKASVAVECVIAPTTFDQIKTMLPNQLAKIAKAFEWKSGQRHRLITTWEDQEYVWKHFLDKERNEFLVDSEFVLQEAGYRTEMPPPRLIPNQYFPYVSRVAVIADGEIFSHFSYSGDREFVEGLLHMNPWLVGSGAVRDGDEMVQVKTVDSLNGSLSPIIKATVW